MSKALGIPVVATTARNKEGLPELLDITCKVVSKQLEPNPKAVRYSPEVEKAISRLEPQIKALFGDNINFRWIALRLLDGDINLIQNLEKYHGRRSSKTYGFTAKCNQGQYC